VDQLNAFARLQQTLDTVRLRLATPPNLGTVESIPVPLLPSLHASSAAVEPLVPGGLDDYPTTENPASRYAYLIRAERRVRLGVVPPEGEGLALWANLQAGRLLVDSLSPFPAVALPLVQRALRAQNYAVIRNAVRILARICIPRAPLPPEDPAMRLLAPVIHAAKPLLMHEGLAVWRQASGLPPWDPREPYEGVDGRGDYGLSDRVHKIRAAGNRPVKPGEPWYIDPAEFGLEGLDEVQGPRGEVLARLGRTATLGVAKDKRRRAVIALTFIEDPLAIPYLREALTDRDVEVRQEALFALGYLGDDSILPICRRALEKKTEWTGMAAVALGGLADSRGFPVLWSAYVRNIAPNAAPAALKILMEACVPMLGRLAGSPALLARPATIDVIDCIWEHGAPNAVLYILDAVGDPRARKAVLKPFAPGSKDDKAVQIGRGLLNLLLARIGDRKAPLELRTAAVESVRQLAGDGSATLLAPVLKGLSPEEAAALGAPPAKGRRGRKLGGKRVA
jgi:hypothetical protein